MKFQTVLLSIMALAYGGAALAQEAPEAWMKAKLSNVLSNPSDVAKVPITVREYRAWPELGFRIDVVNIEMAGNGRELTGEFFYAQNSSDQPLCAGGDLFVAPFRQFSADRGKLITPKSGDSVASYTGPAQPNYSGALEAWRPAPDGSCARPAG